MPIKLLIVEDSELIRASLRGLLSCIPDITRLDEASTLAEALHSVQRDAPDLVILDLHLPDGIGTQIIGTLKQLAPELRIAVLTVHAEHRYRRTCLSLGADWFFDKSTEFETLLDVVHQQTELN